MSERHMIRIDRKPQLFSFRVAGLILRNGHALVQRGLTDDYWALPGGRAEIGETSEQTIVREMREELDQEVAVARLLWTVENFFSYEGYRAHELGFYYLLDLPVTFPFDTGNVVRTITEGPTTVEFCWIPATRAAFEEFRVYPLLLRERIECLPERHEHLIADEGIALA
jgi:ADP-ribose pyrophosphatase YjhB (NUDIX family)